MKCKNKTKLEMAQDKAQAAINKTNETIEELGNHTSSLYDSLTSIQDSFDRIRNVPNDKKLQYEELKKIRLNWKQQAEKIEKDYQVAAVKNAGAGAAGASLGVAIITMGPTVAMGDKKVMKGFVSGGANSHPCDEKAEWLILPDTPTMKCYRYIWECYSLNDITIYWNSPLVFLTAYLEHTKIN